ncbi:hypothetical protein OXYTRIMIC_505 [Oxytricha trifallax]|uniref:Uncharacterized protein n=1 Tax=Oxytricha trifallax TaxID=1172189 RepID=A0A073HXB5_9SPIT|nr:hypothetical protein OXYTRIMIC_505 [Oxytricha trifallax]
MLTSSENFETESDSTFPELNQIERVISKQFTGLTNDAMAELKQQLFSQVPEILDSKLNEKLNQQNQNNIDQIQNLQDKINQIDIQMIQQLVNEGKDEIQNAFQILVNEIKTLSPTIGIVSQEALANHVRRFTELYNNLKKLIDENQIKYASLKENQSKIDNQICQKQKIIEVQQKNLQLNSKSIIEQVNKICTEHLKQMNNNFDGVNDNMKQLNSRLTTIEKAALKSDLEQFTNQKNQNIEQQRIRQNEQQQQSIKNQHQIPDQQVVQTIQRYNAHNKSVKFVEISGNHFLFDNLTKKFLLIQENNYM